MKKFFAALAFLAVLACQKAPVVEPEPEKEDPTDTPTTPPKPARTDCILSIMSFNVAVDNRVDITGWKDRKKAVIKMLGEAKAPAQFQFLRLGYFCVDNKDSEPGHLVFNRAVALKDSFGK